MTRLAFKSVRGVKYVQVVKDYREGDAWRQVVLVSYGKLSPETHARGMAASVLLDRLEVEMRLELRQGTGVPDPTRVAFEAEVVRIVGGEAVNQLRKAYG